MATTSVPAQTALPASRPATTRRRRQAGRTAAVFLLPSFVGVIGFLAVPVVLVIALSFVRWDMLRSPTFAGFANYVDIFRFDNVGYSLLITLYYVLLNIPLQTVVALGLAMLLNRKLPAVGIVRVLCVLPYLATPVAMGVVWGWIFDPKIGAINTLLHDVGITGPAWTSDAAWAMPVVAFANIWQYVGYNMLFFLAGLQAIPHQLYEAATIDGAGAWQRFTRITLPLLRPTMLFVLVTGVIGSFQVFDMVYVLTKGGPGNSTQVMNFHIYQSAFVGFHIGEASAMSVILFAVILLFTVGQFLYFRRRTVYEMT
jgi:multiple sugar transport system permease protein